MEGRECLIFLENSWPPRILFPRNAYTFNFKEDRSILEARWRSRNRFIASNNNTASSKFSSRKRSHENTDRPNNILSFKKRIYISSRQEDKIRLFFTVLRRAFSMFDSTKSGRIEKEKVRTILNTLGHTFDDHELEVLLKQEDEEGIHSFNVSITLPLFFLFLCKTSFRSIIRAIIISSFFFSFSERLARRRIDRLRSSERGRIIIHDIIWPETRGTTCTAVNESRTGKKHTVLTLCFPSRRCLPVFITRAAFNFFQSILIAPPICTQT